MKAPFVLEFELLGLPPTTNGSHGNRWVKSEIKRYWGTVPILVEIAA